MNQIKCPNCGEVFTVDESGYNEIVRQVRDETFEKEIERSIKAAESEKASALQVLGAEKDAEIQKLKAEKDSALTALKAELEKRESEGLAAKDREISTALAEKDKKIAELQAAVEAGEKDKDLAVLKATSERDKELAEQKLELEKLRSAIESGKHDAELNEKNLREKYAIELRAKDEQIEYYKDFKARQSTKMVGESLERHCENEFNKIRAAAFPNAYFEKDNEAVDGTKGDFVFIERDSDGTEIVSIMFEMKNEMDTTASKHKNEDFLKKLDEDRRKKKCEYAVLVSLLEMDSDLYNQGIVDVSHRYEKMYVIRPQFFIPIITMLRNASLKTLDYRRELAIIKNQDIDINNFENEVNDFKDKVARNYKLARDRYEDAIKEIDKTIDRLQKTKEALKLWENNVRIERKKAEELSIKKLTKNNPTMQAKFEKAREANLLTGSVYDTETMD